MARTHEGIETMEAVDVTDSAEVRSLAEEVQASGQARLLRIADRDIAVLLPVAAAFQRERDGVSDHGGFPSGEVTEEDRAAFLAAAGGLAGLVDGERLKADLRATRSQADRDWPPVDQPSGR
jgi:hypothetical protein